MTEIIDLTEDEYILSNGILDITGDVVTIQGKVYTIGELSLTLMVIDDSNVSPIRPRNQCRNLPIDMRRPQHRGQCKDMSPIRPRNLSLEMCMDTPLLEDTDQCENQPGDQSPPWSPDWSWHSDQSVPGSPSYSLPSPPYSPPASPVVSRVPIKTPLQIPKLVAMGNRPMKNKKLDDTEEPHKLVPKMLFGPPVRPSKEWTPPPYKAIPSASKFLTRLSSNVTCSSYDIVVPSATKLWTLPPVNATCSSYDVVVNKQDNDKLSPRADIHVELCAYKAGLEQNDREKMALRQAKAAETRLNNKIEEDKAAAKLHTYRVVSNDRIVTNFHEVRQISDDGANAVLLAKEANRVAAALALKNSRNYARTLVGHLVTQKFHNLDMKDIILNLVSYI